VPDRVPGWLRVAVAVVVALVVAWLVVSEGEDESSSNGSPPSSQLVAGTEVPGSSTDGAPTTPSAGEELPAVGPSGLQAAFTDDLPAEAIGVLDLVEAGGPYPHRQDGSTFFNREGLLPFEPEGYYAEFTVETPGASDRGARRLVVGAGGEVFYTADHYVSFVEVVDADV
jgi:ribonuclease T1